MDWTDEQVRAVERPLFATGMLMAAVTVVLAGAPGCVFGVPNSRILPLVSTAPATTAAIAASTLLVLSGAACVRLATVIRGLQLLSTKPGCEICSGGVSVAWSDRAKT